MSCLKPFRAFTLLASLCACSTESPSTADSTASFALAPGGATYAYERVPLDTTRRPGAVIDSSFPMPEMIRRFRAGLPETTALTPGAASRNELVSQFVAALATSDKTVLGRLTLSRAEFAYLYFPSTAYAKSDQGMPPTLLWDQIALASEKGIARALSRVGGKPLTLDALDCPEAPERSGAMTLYNGCTVRIAAPGDAPFNGRLFSSIIEYAGRFKFVGYSNDM
jgi:hypothetical protein